MDHLASFLLSFPPADGPRSDYDYDFLAREHVKKATKAIQDQISAISDRATQFLNLLDPSTNSISYVLLVEALMGPVFDGKSTITSDDLVDRILAFLLLFDAQQMRYAGSSLTNVLNRAITASIFPDDTLVDLLADVILRIDPSGTMLTSHHLSLATVAYRSAYVGKALDVINRPIIYFPGMVGKREQKLLSDMSLPPPSYISKDTGLTASLKPDQVLEYDFLCGSIYCSSRQWENAYKVFERMVSYPSRDGGVSKIMAEAYKKWILVGLLLNGRTPTLPSYTAASARKSYEVVGKPYASLAAHFESLDAVALKQEAEAQHSLWQDERNLGLVLEVLGAHQKWQIISLRDVYAKVSLADLRERTCSAETGQPLAADAEVEALVAGMIESGMLRGHIEKAGGGGGAPDYLEFLPATEELSEEAFAARMLEAAQRIKALEPVFKATNERLGTHKEYVKHLIKEQRREKDNAGRDVVMDFDAQVEDEDIMGGIMSGH
ncbi:COP9 signalosome complex subunit 3 [Pleurostoma richardsiae]|uniref:COP9 signalosome complex subunit 3 n=1 Tax=Pleurostoma richardsiae TaxID=41990 RepID=A0AA38VPT6_9PEZI|nr:COP9 signalosome complex subunit 3 [Pleurostoma richardsiae]